MTNERADARIAAAVRYLIQLAIEARTDGARYEGGDAVLDEVVAKLLKHRDQRDARKKAALLSELFGSILERLELEDQGAATRSETCGVISKWLKRKGIERTPEEVASLLDEPLGANVRVRGRQEELAHRLGALVGISGSQFIKIAGVASNGQTVPGRLGTPITHERARIDRPPTHAEALFYCMHILGVDDRRGRKIATLFTEPELEEMWNRHDERAYAAELLASATVMPKPTQGAPPEK